MQKNPSDLPGQHMGNTPPKDASHQKIEDSVFQSAKSATHGGALGERQKSMATAKDFARGQ